MSEAFAAHHTPPIQYEKFTPPRMREYVRTPSPTPSERRALDDDGKPHLSVIFRKENWKVILLLVVVCALGILMAVYHDQIVDALKPAANWMYRTPGGWLVPIAVLIVLSIPPLFGHEIVVILIGLTWGLGIGFGIAAAGTIIGELGTFYAFRYCLKGRAEKYEEKQIRYALIARIIRDGGLKMAIVARYSVIPSHLLTALFTTCGMTLITFLISAVVSLPKQFVAVYLGYALAQAQGQESKSSKIAKYITVAITIIVTLAAMRYMRAKQNAVKDQVIYERRKRRQARLAGGPVLAEPSSPVTGDVEQHGMQSQIDSQHTRAGSEAGHATLSGPDTAFKGAGHVYQSVPLRAPEPMYPPSAVMHPGPATMRSMDDLGAVPQPAQPAFEFPNPHLSTSPPAAVPSNQSAMSSNYTNV